MRCEESSLKVDIIYILEICFPNICISTLNFIALTCQNNFYCMSKMVLGSSNIYKKVCECFDYYCFKSNCILQDKFTSHFEDRNFQGGENNNNLLIGE